MPEGLPSGNLSPMMPSLSNAGSPSGPVWDMLLAGVLAANKTPCNGVAPAVEGLPGLPIPGAAAEADALLPPLPPLSAPAAEVGWCAGFPALGSRLGMSAGCAQCWGVCTAVALGLLHAASSVSPCSKGQNGGSLSRQWPGAICNQPATTAQSRLCRACDAISVPVPETACDCWPQVSAACGSPGSPCCTSCA